MTRSDIAKQLAQQVEGLNVPQATKCVNCMVDIMTEALKNQETIFLRGFGTIEAIERKAHTGHNFATGKTMEVPARRNVRLKVSKELLKSLNNK